MDFNYGLNQSLNKNKHYEKRPKPRFLFAAFTASVLLFASCQQAKPDMDKIRAGIQAM
jgi:hypothetical protein